MRSTSLLLIFGVLLSLSLSACDSTTDGMIDEGDVSTNAFELTVESTDQTRTLEGLSFFVAGTEPETGEQAFFIYLTDAEENPEEASIFGIIGRATDRPGTGTYTFVDFDPEGDDFDEELLNDQFILILWEFNDGGFSFHTSTAGTVELTTSSSDRVAGTFELTASTLSFASGEEETVTTTVTGAFDAPGRDDFFDIPFSAGF